MKILISLLLTSVAGCFTGSGRLETRSFALSDFDSIEINRVEAEVVQGDAFAVSVTADDNDWDMLNVSEKDGTLHIELPSDRVLSNVTVHATVTMPVLASLHASGAAHAKFSGFDAPTALDLHASGASDITGSGAATTVTVEGSGSSHLSLEALHAETMQISLSGGSDGTITVDRALDYHLSGGSHLIYFGAPIVGSDETSGGSSAEHR